MLTVEKQGGHQAANGQKLDVQLLPAGDEDHEALQPAAEHVDDLRVVKREPVAEDELAVAQFGSVEQERKYRVENIKNYFKNFLKLIFFIFVTVLECRFLVCWCF